jgi:hypothetical protein
MRRAEFSFNNNYIINMVNLAGLELLLQQLKDKEDIETDKNCLTGRTI